MERIPMMSVCYRCDRFQLSDGSPRGLLESAWAGSGETEGQRMLVTWYGLDQDKARQARAVYSCCPACIDSLMDARQCSTFLPPRQTAPVDAGDTSQAMA